MALSLKIQSMDWKQHKNYNWITAHNRPISGRWLDSDMDWGSSRMCPWTGWASLQGLQVLLLYSSFTPLLFSASSRYLCPLDFGPEPWFFQKLPASHIRMGQFALCLLSSCNTRQGRHSLDLCCYCCVLQVGHKFKKLICAFHSLFLRVTKWLQVLRSCTVTDCAGPLHLL